MRIHEILRAKGYDVITIRPQATVAEMLKLMRPPRATSGRRR